LEIDSNFLEGKVIFENLKAGKELFPRIYGTIPIDAVKDIYQIRKSKRE